MGAVKLIDDLRTAHGQPVGLNSTEGLTSTVTFEGIAIQALAEYIDANLKPKAAAKIKKKAAKKKRL